MLNILHFYIGEIMNTLQELHNMKGKPDLSHWRTVKIFTIAEAGLLIAGFDPLDYTHCSDFQLRDELTTQKPHNWQHALMLIRSITEAICTHEIKSPFINIERSDYDSAWDVVEEQAKVSIDDSRHIIFTSTKIHRDELYKWLGKNGYLEAPSPRKREVITVDEVNEKSLENKGVLLLPQLSYRTPALNAAFAVIREFWEDFNPTSGQAPPKQDYVKHWIAENHPEIDSNVLREAIDKICRHPDAKMGGNTKLKK